ncbi:uncharacterized protein LOC114256706 isoform X2 [Camellia sinensis]|uniref:uncharacterized protein LOC114256706 isoform X2 n=1 Tax=Camellia sinensis TaxID=4442 RepID=UPI001036CA2A|nr:uncharacterized protein LOC114256706 isoform X2 [Camellia sinensis]
MAMSTTTTTLIVPYSSANLHVKPPCNKLQTLIIFNNLIPASSKHKYGSCFLVNRGLSHFSNRQRSLTDTNSKMKSWILGTLISIMLPFLRHKWGPLFNMTKQVEAAVETAERVTEVIEKVAEEVEELAEEVADGLPEGGKLRGAVEFVENAAKETAKVAHLAEELIDKVEEVEKEVESFMEPVNDQTNADGTTE